MTIETVMTTEAQEDARGFFMDLFIHAPVDPASYTIARLMVAGPMILVYIKNQSDKQGRWSATYTDSPKAAADSAVEWLAGLPMLGTVQVVSTAWVQLSANDLLSIENRAKRGPDARFRAVHWSEQRYGAAEDHVRVLTP